MGGGEAVELTVGQCGHSLIAHATILSNCGIIQHMPKTIESPSQPEVRIATVSTVEAAANAIRDLILDGELTAGTRLRENDFAERLGVARHSFRAATQILIGEGLLRREPNRGVQVPVFSREDVEDIFKLRAALEIEAARLAIEAGSVPADASAAVTELSGL